MLRGKDTAGGRDGFGRFFRWLVVIYLDIDVVVDDYLLGLAAGGFVPDVLVDGGAGDEELAEESVGGEPGGSARDGFGKSFVLLGGQQPEGLLLLDGDLLGLLGGLLCPGGVLERAGG